MIPLGVIYLGFTHLKLLQLLNVLERNNETLHRLCKNVQIVFPATEIERYKRPLCHDSATIYLQFNSKLDSYTIIYCQLDRKKIKRDSLCPERDFAFGTFAGS